MKPGTILNHRNIYIFSLIFLGVSLPLSIYTTSLAEIILVVNWLIEGKFKNKFQILKRRPSILLITALYMLHIVGLLYTSDFSYALHDLKTKLPILLLPLIIGTSGLLNARQLRTVLLFFSTAVVASSLVSIMIFYGIIPIEFYDIRDISILISHIRLSLMVILTIYILIYYLFVASENLRFIRKAGIFVYPAIIFLIFFLYLLKSLTGIIIFTIVSLSLIWIASGKFSDVAPKFILRVLIITIPLLVALYLSNSIERFYSREQVNFSNLEEYTASGNKYEHDTLQKATENGNYVWIYLCEEELRECWNTRSSFKYDNLDQKQQEIKYILIRFLTSKGYRKDCEGVNLLTDREVTAIEKGLANYIFLNNYSLYPRIYVTIWEIDSYLRGGNPSNHSITQRIEYLKAAKHIIKNHFLIGTGTGDVQNEFNIYYQKHDSQLGADNRRRAHNQYVTLFLTFGLIGFIASMIFILLPVFYERRWNDFLFMVFFIIILLSMLNEDTLETQTGVSFFIFFYSLLLFGRKREINN